MGAVIQFQNKNNGTLDTKWSSILDSMDESPNGDAIAIRIDNEGNIDIHHSADIDPFTLIGLLEVFKAQLIHS